MSYVAVLINVIYILNGEPLSVCTKGILLSSFSCS